MEIQTMIKDNYKQLLETLDKLKEMDTLGTYNL